MTTDTLVQTAGVEGLRASVIICTYNRAHLLARVLRALSDQTASPDRFEIIVVVDGSSDGTKDVCIQSQSTLKNLHCVVIDQNSGTSNAMNVGVRHSRGAYLLFTDDDCIPRRDWVARMCSALDRVPLAAGTIESPVTDYAKLCHNIAEFHPFLPGHRPGEVPFIAGANMGARRSLIEEMNGFQSISALTPDMEIVLRLRASGYRVQLVTDATVIHDPDRTDMPTIFAYAARHARRTIILRNQHGKLLRTPFVLKSPLLILIASPAIASFVTIRIYIQNRRTRRYWATIPVVAALKMAWCWGAARGLLAFVSQAAVPGGWDRKTADTEVGNRRCGLSSKPAGLADRMG